ncbi:glycoside hydrolase family protein [Caulobacter sp. KR2-114]|uniref:glycoside hydrolase family protein n=1 Tax=Caulobacter sp. KR2-114 TaxID=3400912 RepID=UPI003BFEF925
MTPRHQISRAAINLIKRFEGFRSKAAELDDGRWTIGYGHTKTARSGTEIAEADAEALLLYDLINVAHAVNEWTYAPLNQNQFDALVSFAFNIGLENFRRSTTLRRINEGRMLEAALAMELWRRADFEGERIVVDALVRRRAYEKSLFLKPVDAWAPAPSPVLPPKIDYDVAPFTLTSTPAVLKTELSGERAIAERVSASPLVPLEDTGPTATETAAAALARRLEALAAEPSAAPVLEAPVRDPLPTPEPEARPVVAPPPAAQDELPPPIEATHEEIARDIDTVPGAPVIADVAAAEPDLAFTPAPKPPVRRQPVSVLVWAGLAFLGLALFAAAVKFGFKTPAAGSIGGLDPVVFGLGAGLIGIAFTAIAVYQLLMRLAGPDTAKSEPPKETPAAEAVTGDDRAEA